MEFFLFSDINIFLIHFLPEPRKNYTYSSSYMIFMIIYYYKNNLKTIIYFLEIKNYKIVKNNFNCITAKKTVNVHSKNRTPG